MADDTQKVEELSTYITIFLELSKKSNEFSVVFVFHPWYSDFRDDIFLASSSLLEKVRLDRLLSQQNFAQKSAPVLHSQCNETKMLSVMHSELFRSFRNATLFYPLLPFLRSRTANYAERTIDTLSL